MLVANNFDLWQKDAFFSAAEEVQQSADLMESAFRVWMRAKREESVALAPYTDELVRELQMALGTAKWQLEEFEKAVFVSYKSHGNDATIRRHKDFISAMGDQISHVENTLMDHFVQGKKPFSWVNLDEEERDDLALFLSGAPKPPRWPVRREDMTSQENNEEVASISVEAADRSLSSHRTRGSPHQDVLEIVIDRNDGLKETLTEESTPKERASKVKAFLQFSSHQEHPEAKFALNLMFLRVISWAKHWLLAFQRLRVRQTWRHQVPPVTAVKSIHTILILMLTILLIVKLLWW